MKTDFTAKNSQRKEHKPSKQLRQAVDRFLNEVDAEFFSKSLRFMLIEFMRTEEGKSSPYSDRLLDHIERLYFLLDEMEEENKRTGLSNTLFGLYD